VTDKSAQEEKVKQSLDILVCIGMPDKQLNSRTALTLLAVAGIGADQQWAETGRRPLGINEIINWMELTYPAIRKGRIDPTKYAPNSRESVRRQSVKQLIAAGVLEANADRPDRPKNDQNTRYRLTEIAAQAIREYDSPSWEESVEQFHSQYAPLRERWAAEREKQLVPLRTAAGKSVKMSSGRHSELIADVVNVFAPCFTPGGVLAYLGDTGEKWLIEELDYLSELGIMIDPHGKMPDVVIHFTEKNWLVLVEAVTSHGPMNPIRVDELKELFKESIAGMVFVSAFPDAATFRRHAADISWETEVWIRESPTHMIHYNGERFLGPYE
jgi:type II restriction enzyme